MEGSSSQDSLPSIYLTSSDPTCMVLEFSPIRFWGSAPHPGLSSLATAGKLSPPTVLTVCPSRWATEAEESLRPQTWKATDWKATAEGGPQTTRGAMEG